MQLNAQSSRPNLEELKKLIIKEGADIVTIQETWLKEDDVIKIPDFTIVRKDRTDGYEGVAIMIRNNLTIEERTMREVSDSVQTVGIELRSKNMLINNSYVTPTTNSNQLKNLWQIIR